MTASSLLVEPAYTSVPAYTRTLGPEVGDLSRLASFPPDPEQSLILDAVFAIGQHGRSAAFEAAVIASRQNLKTGVFKMCAMGWLVLTGERLIVWSAHEFRTAQEAFRDLEELFFSSDVLRRQVAKVTRADGDESIIMKSGSRLIFKTRTKGGGRGLTGDKVILDEGFALRPMHMGALLPTLSARPDPQVVYGSSAGLVDSGVLRGVRDRGRAGADARLAYFEWCAPEPRQVCRSGDACTHSLTSVGCGCDEPANWQRANPALGRRITAEYIAAERRALPPEEFGRERMGWWDDPAEGLSPVSAQDWNTAGDAASKIVGALALGVDIAPDRSEASIAAGGRRGDGLGHGELADHRPGTGWVVARLAEMVARNKPCAVVIDPGGPAGSLEKELLAAGFHPDPGPGQTRLQLVGAREYAQACGALADDITNARWKHLRQQPLDAAVAAARSRPLADAWAWSRSRSSGSITPLVAVTLARHGFMTHGLTEKPKPFAMWGR